jgi:hypothetical protein
MAGTSDEGSGLNEGFRDHLARVTVPPELDKEELANETWRPH